MRIQRSSASECEPCFRIADIPELEVKNLHIKPSDPIAVPKPATLEAEVLEGPRYRAEIKFTGNHAFSADELRSKFSLKKGALISRERVVSGLDSLREVYVSNGLIDFLSIPNTQNSFDAMVTLSIGVMEGTQYHVGKLAIGSPFTAELCCPER